MTAISGDHPFDYMADQRAVLLTSYKRDGTPVGTPVNIFVEGDRAFVRTYDKSWKFRRMMHNPEVEVAPSTMNGKVTGPAVHAHARLLTGDEAEHAGDLIEHKHRLLQGVFVPLYHKVKHYETVHFELTAA
ncbi:MAG TPA: PPOX class F420-dependent oxidoreductase [Dehalococcoidia bacterium]|nr:PPOX class F420-dependent oxidoreductase [Dehalococcoidia bacterium]